MARKSQNVLWVLGVLIAFAVGWAVGHRNSSKGSAQPVKLDMSQATPISGGTPPTPAPPPEHHYQFQNAGSRTFRFDPATGQSCMQLASKQDWKNADTIRQGCEYLDWVDAPQATVKDRLSAECYLVNNKTACKELLNPPKAP